MTLTNKQQLRDWFKRNTNDGYLIDSDDNSMAVNDAKHDFAELEAIFAQQLQAAREAVEWPEVRPVDWQDISTPDLVARQSENYGFNEAVKLCKAALEKGLGL
jgi:hypothetical protein